MNKFDFKLESNILVTFQWERTSEECWEQCHEKGGRCSFCGENGYCCRRQNHSTWNGNCPLRGILTAAKDKHVCVSSKTGS